MKLTSLLTPLLTTLLLYASASSSKSLRKKVAIEEIDDCVNDTLPMAADPEEALTPIDLPSPTSTTFQLVDDVRCNSTVSEKLYTIYTKNRALFDLCVADAHYQIFPFLGVEPSTEQVKNMASSTACAAVFASVLLAKFPQCTISGFSLKAAAETLLKIHVDLTYWALPSPTAERFQELLAWRRCVNLAKDAGAPYDQNSEMYAEFEKNLRIAESNNLIRLLPDYSIVYKLASGSWYIAEDNYARIVGKVSPGNASKVSDSEASHVLHSSRDNSASMAMGHGVVSVVMGLLFSALLMTS